MKRLFFTLLTLLALCSCQPVLAADSTNLKLQILPIDCVFEIVQDGLNTITYLTPAECGKYVPPPFIDQPASPTNPPGNPVKVAPNSTPVPLFHNLPNQTPTATKVIPQKPATTARVDHPSVTETAPPAQSKISLKLSLSIAGGILASFAVLFGLYHLIVLLIPE